MRTAGTRQRALVAGLGLFAIALFCGCQGAQVGGQSGSEGCTEENDTFRAFAAPDGGQDAELLDDDAGVIETTALEDPAQCPAP